MLIYDIPEKRDPGPYEDPGLYEDSEFFDDPGKTQELDFHIMCHLMKFAIKSRFIYQC